jgi:hypothetical protein
MFAWERPSLVIVLVIIQGVVWDEGYEIEFGAAVVVQIELRTLNCVWNALLLQSHHQHHY